MNLYLYKRLASKLLCFTYSYPNNICFIYFLIQDHNGYVVVNSTVGKGTTFELYFPVYQEINEANVIRVGVGKA
jgi:hypothetical protein